ncbi:MAG: hypothetical protein QOE31_3640 [Solirubrobacteraceae bacterium]|nr:hypothetical protein [Solirubrobacteraceae bacterium]
MRPAPPTDRTCSRTRRCVTLAVSLVVALLMSLPAVAQAAPPDNDDFAAAQTVHVGDRVTGTTAEATLETGEPATSSLLITRTVWYRLTASATETLRIDSCSSPRFAELAIYTGADVGALTAATYTPSGCGSGGRFYLAATAGTTYHVRLAAYGDYNGDVVLNVARPQAPANDDFEDAQPIGRPAHITSSNVDATTQPGEPQPGIGDNGHSVWYSLKATTSDVVWVGTCNAGNSMLVAVYTGPDVGHLSEVGTEAGACGYRANMLVTTKPGTTYYIAVTGAGDFVLDVSAPDPGSPPSNPPPPPTPTCPFVFAPGLPTYSGTHSGGGSVCVTLSKDFSGVEWFHAIDIPGNTCRIPWRVDHMDLPTPVVDRRFSYGSSFSRIIGSFSNGREARGTLQVDQLTGPLSFCNSPVLTWTATTTATPPWLDETAPALRLHGAAVQRPLRRPSLAVLVQCPKEACTASASATVAGVRVKSARHKVAKGQSGRTLRLGLSARALRAVRSALRSHASIRTRVAVVATDAAANRASARRTLTLRR